MNIVYGGLAILISLVVSKLFSTPDQPRLHSFVKAFVVGFVAVLALGLIFYYFDLGFFEQSQDSQSELQRVFGFSAFLALLMGLKASNRLVPEQEKEQD